MLGLLNSFSGFLASMRAQSAVRLLRITVRPSKHAASLEKNAMSAPPPDSRDPPRAQHVLTRNAIASPLCRACLGPDPPSLLPAGSRPSSVPPAAAAAR